MIKIGNDYYINLGMTVNGKTGIIRYGHWNTHTNTTITKSLQIPQETYTAEFGYSFFLLGDARKTLRSTQV